ncbi:hypothetical protein VIBNIPon4_130130 [Vibrio nigripulchritudo POn4]|nr:hypothetical protein VIBNIPon4_130130 [Vibrio nigripulchritudo POn4]
MFQNVIGLDSLELNPNHLLIKFEKL